MLPGKIEVTPEFLASAEPYSELRQFVPVLHWTIPILWLLVLLILWRISQEGCIHAISRNYKILVGCVVLISVLFYSLSFILINLMQSLSVLVASLLLIVGMTYSVLRRYKEEYLE